jgi:protein-tyrosine-phosphatase
MRDYLGRYIRGLRAVVKHLASPLAIRREVRERRMAGRVDGPVRRVLFLCKGNICRSPFAAEYFRLQAEKSSVSVEVRSAGLETTPGKPAHQYARLVAKQQGVPLEAHITSVLEARRIEEADIIIVMELIQKDRVASLYPKVRGKVVLLGAVSPDCPLEIEDPYSGTIEDFQVCFGQIRKGCDALMALVEQGRQMAPSS